MSSTGRFINKCCGCNNIPQATNDSLIKVTRLYAAIKKILFERGIISSRSTFLCKSCIENALPSCQRQEPDLATKFQEFLGDIVEAIKKDITSFKKDGKSADDLSEFNGKDWAESRPPILLNVLKVICGIDETSTRRDNLKLCKIIDVVYSCHSSHLVSPLSYLENEVTYQISRSRQLVELNNAISPSGS